MLLEQIEAVDLRNLAGKAEFAAGLNFLTGENGQGKTNWLESIHILATARSFRTQRLTEVLAFDTQRAVVRGVVRRTESITRELAAVVEGNTKSLFVNGKKETVQGYLGHLHAVVFNAEQLEIVRGLPDSRRRFLDAAIVSIHPPYLQTLADYNRVIKQKNALLQTAREHELPLPAVAEQVLPWNEQLAVLASRIHRSRVRYVLRLNEVLERSLFEREEVSIRYRSSLEDKGDLEQYAALMNERLALRVQAELAAGHSLIGPHRDDLDILFDGRELRKYGSAGQQRSALLLLQLANISIYHSQQDEYPLFLLDDIDAELDYRRIGRLFEYLEDKTQTFVTTSKASFAEQFSRGSRILTVSGGKTSPYFSDGSIQPPPTTSSPL